MTVTIKLIDSSLGLGGQEHGTHQPNGRRMHQLLSRGERYIVNCLTPIINCYSLRRRYLELISNTGKQSGQMTAFAVGRRLSHDTSLSPSLVQYYPYHAFCQISPIHQFLCLTGIFFSSFPSSMPCLALLFFPFLSVLSAFSSVYCGWRGTVAEELP